MSVFDKQRLTDSTFKIDIERMRKGWYSDKYFTNIARMLTVLSESGYIYQGNSHRLPADVLPDMIKPGDIEVEMQWFTRRAGETVIVGVDKALTMLRKCTGHWVNKKFINTADQLQVWAVHDGAKVYGDGNPNPGRNYQGRRE